VEAWSREAVGEWVGDDLVLCLDARADRAPVPDWLLSGAGEARNHSVGQRLAATRADDRQRVIDLWWEVMAQPGRPFDIEVTVQGEDGWSRERMRYLNLVDDPDVAAVVVAVAFLGTSEGLELPDVLQSGEFEAVNLLIHELDSTGVILRTEGRVLEISGRSPEEVIGQNVLDHLHPDGFDDAIKTWLEVMGGPAGTTRTGRQRVQRPDGTTIWVENTLIKRVADDGTVTATVFCHDLTERRRQEAALRTSQLEFRLLADQVPAAVFRADEDQLVTFRNERWPQLVGWDPSVRHLRDIVSRHDRERFDLEIEALVAASGPDSASLEVRSRDGQRVYLVTCRSVPDLVNDRRSLVGAVTDITDTVELRERAEHDPLTGLHNRTAIEARLAQALAEGPEDTVVVFVDLDGFKQVNDTYGHEAGDHVLAVLAGRLRTRIRPQDLVGRYGGDEFVLILRDASVDDAAIMARLEEALVEPVRWSGGSWSPGVSIGVARPGPGDVPATLLRRADHEMFASKRQHKLRLIGPAPDPDDPTVESARWGGQDAG
jgi:diguanylate cyclase (GGDEF)-like protein/PAS domain S-box-containing protein